MPRTNNYRNVTEYIPVIQGALAKNHGFTKEQAEFTTTDPEVGKIINVSFGLGMPAKGVANVIVDTLAATLVTHNMKAAAS